MDNKLIFDLGFYTGDTSLKYLKLGYKVIGVECNPNMLNNIYKNFDDYIKNDKLIIVDKCIAEDSNNDISFFICNYKSDWSSCNKNIPLRTHNDIIEICVESITLNDLISEYGCPIYCKIDIEGNDILALKSLRNTSELPKYISCETECLGKDEDFNSSDYLEIINELKNLGYTKFALIQQGVHNKEINSKTFDEFEYIDYENAVKQLTNARKQHFEYCFINYSFWWDVYATY